jgi:hypothetical protein
LKFENEVVENVGVVVNELGCDIIVNRRSFMGIRAP